MARLAAIRPVAGPTPRDRHRRRSAAESTSARTLGVASSSTAPESACRSGERSVGEHREQVLAAKRRQIGDHCHHTVVWEALVQLVRAGGERGVQVTPGIVKHLDAGGEVGAGLGRHHEHPADEWRFGRAQRCRQGVELDRAHELGVVAEAPRRSLEPGLGRCRFLDRDQHSPLHAPDAATNGTLASSGATAPHAHKC